MNNTSITATPIATSPQQLNIMLEQLRSVARNSTPIVAPRHVSNDDLMSRARSMALRGYVFEQATLDALRAYMEGYNLFLRGSAGCGKTTFFTMQSAIIPSNHDHCHRPTIHIMSMPRMASMTTDEVRAELDRLIEFEVVIDDIGSETVNNTYGVRSEVLSLIMDIRMSNPRRTHITTNLDGESLRQRYGDRIVDRMRMFLPFILTASTYRHPVLNTWLCETSNQRTLGL